MNMKRYEVTLKTLGPVHVGDGQKIGKKEYVYDPKAKKYYIPDMPKLFGELTGFGLLDSYENYLLKDNRANGFFEWLKENKLLTPGVKPQWAAYSMSCTDIDVSKLQEISSFVKNPYGMAYIPGSGIKGMMRTVILSALTYESYIANPDELKNEREKMHEANEYNIKKTASNTAGDLENHFLRTLVRDKKKPNNAVNDIMSGFIVGDSKPIEAEKLVLCQSVDLFTDGKKNTLPIMFECLPPDTEIKFDLTITPQYFKYSKDDLLRFVQKYSTIYKGYFRSAFPPIGAAKRNFIHIGGICGYATKTLAYPLMLNKAVEPISLLLDILFPKKPRRDHKHYADLDVRRNDGKDWGVSPHTLKCTKYNGRLYEMGLCSVDFRERN